jgi:hypothetical protein
MPNWKKRNPIKDFLRTNRAELFSYGVPVDLLDDASRFMYFAEHGYDAGGYGFAASGLIHIKELSPDNRKKLADLVALEFGESYRLCLDPGYLRR